MVFVIYIGCSIILLIILIDAIRYWFAPVLKADGIICEKIYTVGYGYNSNKKWVIKPDRDKWDLIIKIGEVRATFPISKWAFDRCCVKESILCTYKKSRIGKAIRIKAIYV